MTENKKRSWGKITLSICIVLIVLIGGALLYVNHLYNKSLAQTEGELLLKGLDDEVVVVTDDQGVPHIEAKSDKDLYMAQGYVQAQHRLLQMELSRRQASGTLSELIGSALVEQDKYFRTLGLRRAAAKSYDLYSDEAKQVLDWFSDGVNAYIEEAKENKKLPIEFKLIGADIEEWTPLDSLTIGKFMAYDLGGHWERQAFNYYLLHTYSTENAYELFPSYPDDGMTVIEEDELDLEESYSYLLNEDYVDVTNQFKHAVIPEPFNGSNNWVVSGDKTESGKPLLADDPHLGLATPSIWLQMHLKNDAMNVSGVIFAGVPGIILGHNETIAWGVTNTGPDVQQLYIERSHPDEDHIYQFEDEWEEAEVIPEPIKVKGEDTIDYEVVETRHGPIVSEFAEASAGDTAFSLSWTALDPTPELQAILEINKASNWEEFEKALENFHAPAQNFVFASIDGTIAYKANGKIPIYKEASNALLPLPGWDKDYELDEYIPFDELPKVINPDKGFIATANNKVTPNNYPYHISNVWAQPYRYERIFEVLDEKDTLTIEDMQNLQMDATNLRAREFVPQFVDILKEAELDEQSKEALSLLEEWNYEDDVNLAAPLIFDKLMNEIDHILYEEIEDDALDLFTGMPQATDQLLRKGNRSVWIDDAGGVSTLLKVAFENTIEQLSEDYGSKVSNWSWGDFHQVQFKHPLGSANKWLGYLYNKKPIPVNGSAVTPLAARAGEDGIVNHGASWRFVIDMDEPGRGYHIVGPGQSENIKSPWYSNQLQDWVDGVFHETNINSYEGDILQLKAN